MSTYRVSVDPSILTEALRRAMEKPSVSMVSFVAEQIAVNLDHLGGEREVMVADVETYLSSLPDALRFNDRRNRLNELLELLRSRRAHSA